MRDAEKHLDRVMREMRYLFDVKDAVWALLDPSALNSVVIRAGIPALDTSKHQEYSVRFFLRQLLASQCAYISSFSDI